MTGRGGGATLGEHVISLVPRRRIDPNHGGTVNTTADNALDFLVKTVPGFLERLRDKDVLDYGCGHGWQGIAIARLGIARSVTGLDIRLFDSMRANACAAGVDDRVEFIAETRVGRTFDVVYSCSSFEHFRNPGRELRRMIELTRPGGQIVISFAEPWYSPHGSHFTGYTGLPWSNILFSEETMMRVRAHYRSDGATRYEDIEGGLNKMSVAKFERIIAASGLTVADYRLWAVKRLPLVTRLPVLRELFTAAVSCVLLKPMPCSHVTR